MFQSEETSCIVLSDGNWLEDSRHVQAAPAFGFLNGTSVSSLNYATNKEFYFCLNRELTKQRHELRYQGVEGSLDRKKDKGKPELVLSELDRLHPISAACLQVLHNLPVSKTVRSCHSSFVIASMQA